MEETLRHCLVTLLTWARTHFCLARAMVGIITQLRFLVMALAIIQTAFVPAVIGLTNLVMCIGAPSSDKHLLSSLSGDEITA